MLVATVTAVSVQVRGPVLEALTEGAAVLEITVVEVVAVQPLAELTVTL